MEVGNIVGHIMPRHPPLTAIRENPSCQPRLVWEQIIRK